MARQKNGGRICSWKSGDPRWTFGYKSVKYGEKYDTIDWQDYKKVEDGGNTEAKEAALA